MSKRHFVLTLVAIFLALRFSAEAQQGTKVYRIGLLRGSSASTAKRQIDAFRDGLRELGYVESKNFVFEPRYAEGKVDRLPELASELVRLKVDIILATGTEATAAAKQATSTIPIVGVAQAILWEAALWRAWPGPAEISQDQHACLRI